MRQPVPFGKYLLLERISVGGMAEVFKAKSFGVEGFEKIIAIKRILPSMAEDREFIQMFIDEAKIAGQLSHANICQIFELGKIGDSHFIAMEFIWGKDLLQIQNRYRKLRQTMPVAMACFIAAKVCEGLDYAHRKKDALGRPLNIIHRDVSPQNVLISYEGEVKMIDFGIAKAASRSSKTQAGVLKGKFGYMSPEQVRGLPLDRRSDLFAIGTLLYEMLTGERLFVAESDFSTLEKVRNADVEPPSHLNRNITPALEKIVMRGLTRNAEDRYQWANEMQEELQQFLMGLNPIFTAKQMSSWMKEAFEQELSREKATLEQFKRMGRDGLFQGHAAANAAVPVDAGYEETLPLDAEGGEKTLISEPSFDAQALIAAAAAAHGHPPPPRVRPPTGQTFGEEGPTEIYGETASPSALPPLAGEATTILPGGSSAVPPPSMPPPAAPPIARAAAEAKTLFEMEAPKVVIGGLGQTPLPGRVPETAMPPSPSPGAGMGVITPVSGSHLVYQAPLLSPPGMPALGSSPGSAFGDTGGVARLSPVKLKEPKKPSMARDLGIGAAAAVAVAALITGGYFLVTRVIGGEKKVAAKAAVVEAGTLVVATGDGGEGEVFVAGQRKGAITGGEPLTVEGVAPGKHEITVKRPGAPDCVQAVDIEARGTKVITCRFEAVKPGKLVLAVPPGAIVLVDQQEVSADAVKEPLVLAPGVPHKVEVRADGFQPQVLDVTLAPGEVQERAVVLEAAVAQKTPPPPVVVEVAKPEVKLEDKPDKPEVKPEDKPKPDKPDGKPVVVADKPDKPDKPADKPDKPDKPKDTVVKPDVKPDKPRSDEVGYLIANTTPWSRVLIDNKDTGKMTPIAPRAKIPLKPGKHTVTFVVGDKKFSYPIVIEPGKDMRLIKQLPVDDPGG